MPNNRTFYNGKFTEYSSQHGGRVTWSNTFTPGGAVRGVVYVRFTISSLNGETGDILVNVTPNMGTIYQSSNYGYWGRQYTKGYDGSQASKDALVNTGFSVVSNAVSRPWVASAEINFTECQRAITPTVVSPQNSVVRTPAVVFTWSDDRWDDEELKSVQIELRPFGAEESEVIAVEPIGLKTFSITVPESVFQAESFEWRVTTESLIGVKTSCEWETVEWTAPQMSVGDLYPTSKTYHGFPVMFRWLLSTSAEGVYQTSAEVQYRLRGGVDYSVAGVVTGGGNTLTVAGDALPVGDYDWRVVVHTNSGYDATSNWQGCTNVEVPISISGLFPDASGRAPSRVANRFGWTFVAEDKDAPGAVTQESATLYWRPAGQGQYTSIAVQGALQYIDIAAGTLPLKSSIEWYVKVRANTGTEATSETITVSTVDTASTPVAISPAGVFLDDSLEGVTFTWQHVNATGTAQTGYELSYSEDSGASYKVLQAADGAATSWESKPLTFAIGSVYWRVRTKNSDGDYGDYSAAAFFAIRRRPDAPTIVSFDQKPLPSIAWQSETQTGYEVEVDGVSYGMVYGSTKTWRSPALLSDGPHTIRVRIVNQYRDVSAWSTVEINVLNAPHGEISLEAEEQWAQVSLGWALPEEFTTTCLLRDGELISVVKAASGTFADRASVGSHSYVLRAFDADGYYTDSPAVTAAPRVPYGAIGLLDGDDWTVLKWSPSLDRYSCSRSQQGSFVQIYGHDAPEWRENGSRTVVHSLAYAKKRGEDLQPLFDMAGKTVVYKDYEGHIAVGTFPSINVSGGRAQRIELEITETWQKGLDYAAV